MHFGNQNGDRLSRGGRCRSESSELQSLSATGTTYSFTRIYLTSNGGFELSFSTDIVFNQIPPLNSS